MYAGQGAILRRWLEPPFSADGWRIDVANMLGRQGPVQLGPEVARGMRAAVKDANPDAYLMGEHFYDATDALNGDQWDGVMNYAGFTNPVLEWLSVVEHRSAGFGTVVAGAARTTDEMVAVARRLPRRDPVGGGPLPVRPARQPRHAAGPVAWSATRAGCGPRSGCCSATSGCPGSCTATRSGSRARRATRAASRCRGTRRPGTSTTSSSPARSCRFRARSRALQAGGFQVLETGADSLAFLRDTDDEQVIVVVVRGPGSRTGDLPVAHRGDRRRHRVHLAPHR